MGDHEALFLSFYRRFCLKTLKYRTKLQKIRLCRLTLTPALWHVFKNKHHRGIHLQVAEGKLSK